MQLCSAPILARRLQLSLLGMSTECIDPWTGRPQSQTQSLGGGYGALASGGCLPPPTSASWNLPRWRASLAAAVLCYINLLNYMNWFIIPGEQGRGDPGQDPRYPHLTSPCLCTHHGLAPSTHPSLGAHLWWSPLTKWSLASPEWSQARMRHNVWGQGH